jgi:hypothetical protein
MSMGATKRRDNIHKKRERWNRIGGSITVEASFVLPLVILITFALIYFSFFLHDMCRIRGVVDETLHKAGLACKHESSLETGEVRYEAVNHRGVFYIITGDTEQEEKAMNYHILSQLSGGLLLSRILAVDSEVGKLSLSASVRVRTKVKLPVFGKLFDKYSITKITGSYPIHNPAETLRACETVLHTGSEIKGAEQLKSRLQKFLP